MAWSRFYQTGCSCQNRLLLRDRNFSRKGVKWGKHASELVLACVACCGAEQILNQAHGTRPEALLRTSATGCAVHCTHCKEVLKAGLEISAAARLLGHRRKHRHPCNPSPETKPKLRTQNLAETARHKCDKIPRLFDDRVAVATAHGGHLRPAAQCNGFYGFKVFWLWLRLFLLLLTSSKSDNIGPPSSRTRKEAREALAI